LFAGLKIKFYTIFNSMTLFKLTTAVPNGSSRQVKVLAGWKRSLAILAGAIVRVWVATLRFVCSPATARTMRRIDGPQLYVLWHDRLFIAADIARRFRGRRPLHALISTSNDGAWLTEFFATMGLCAVRGSSSRGGREAASELVRVLRSGADAGITPDGPRGPAYIVKPGALTVARRSGARIILVGVIYESYWCLNGWDSFRLPKPFSKIHMSAQYFDAAKLRADDALGQLEQELLALNRFDVTDPAIV
jgi:lysophospholipid acyltransferase (LPLAT)-like uncharacterized protein